MKIKTITFAGFGLVGQRRYSFLKKMSKVKVIGVSDQYASYRQKFREGKSFKNFRQT